MALLGFFSVAGSLHATQAPTTTAISVTATDGSPVTSIASGTIVVLTASVTQPSTQNPNVTVGLVTFCDADAAYCEDAHLIGTAQLRSNGTAVLKFKPAPGAHRYNATFAGTTGLAASTSFTESLTVTGGPFATTTSIAQSGSAGNYTLTATVTSANASVLSPSGTVDFLDTSNSNYVLGSGSLVASSATSSYAPFVGYSPGGNIGVLVADFNQDGIPDLLVWGEGSYVFGGNNFLGVLLGKGDGTFQNVMGYNFNSNAYYPSAIAVGDVNGDGYPDVVVADGETNQLYVLLNDGTGDGHLGWQHTYQFPTFSYNGSVQLPVGPVTGIAIGDVNGDGKPDLAITLSMYGDPNLPVQNYENGGEFGVMLGNGDGSFQTTSSAPWVTSYPSGFYAEPVDYAEPIELVDTRANGRLDVVITDTNTEGACVSLNNGDGTFASPTCYGAPTGQSVAVGDFNGDGKPDLLVTSWSSANGSSVVLLGNGDGTFRNANANLPSGISSVALGDLNGDGKLDAVLTTNSSSNGPATLLTLYGNGDGTFGTPITYNGGADGDTLGFSAVADLNGDGVPDIVVTDSVATANVMLGSVSKTATVTATGISPVGPASNTDAVEASYEGDEYYSSSTSGTTSMTAQPVTTSLGLQSNLSSVTVGGQITLTATLSPGSAQNYTANGETVTFYNNGASIGTATLTNGVATLQPHLDVVQSDSLTASYPGDSNFNSSSSGPVLVTVQKASTNLTLQVCAPLPGPNLTCPATTMMYGPFVQITATLSPYNVNGGSTSDGEIVTFYNNGTSIGTAALQYGSATLTLNEPNVGSYSFTASYGGDASFNSSSTSSPALLTVNQVTSGLGLQIFPTPTSTYGQNVFLTATFFPDQASSDTIAGETVTFYNNGTVIGTAALTSNVTASLTLTNLPVGSYSFAARYAGDQNFTSSNSTPVSLSIQRLATSISVNPNPSGTTIYGNPITLQASLLPSNVPGGNTTNGDLVTFYDNGNSIGTASLSNGTATFTLNLPPSGNNSFAATFGGDASFASSFSQPASVLVERASTSMGIATNAVNGAIGSGQPLTLTATLLPYAVTGGATTNGEPVTFFENGNNIGTGTLANGVATFVVNGLTEGFDSFSASYSGDSSFSGSNASPPATVQVLQSTSLTMTTSPAHFAALNQGVSLIATLSPYTSAGDSTNGELVIFYNGVDNIGNAPLVNGVATISLPNGLPEGQYSFTAVFQGDAYLAGSTSGAPVSFSVATIENFVVNSLLDDAGLATNCTPQASTTSNGTDSSCSLRDALLAAAAAPEGANITFDTSTVPGPVTITLNNGALTVPSNTTITGPTLYGGNNLLNLVTVSGGGGPFGETDRVFTVTGTGAAISNLTITGGYPVWNNGNPLPGGGIANSGSLTLTNCEITGNGDIENAGGIYNTGTLTIIGSSIDNNQGAYNGPGNGGGIDNENNGTLTIVNSTIANNTVTSGFGGGIYMGSGSLTMTNSTVSANLGARHNGIDNEGSGAVVLANSIVSGNIGVGWNDILGNYTDNGGNIIGNANGNQITSFNNLKLSALGNYGGPTPTMLPLPGSIAICGGSILLSPSQWQPQSVQIDTDQRGFLNYTESYQPLGGPALCVDAGAVQSSYTGIQFAQSSYTSGAGTAVTPAIVVSVGENGYNRGGIPVTLTYSGPGFLSGNGPTTTVRGVGATFDNLSVDTIGSGTLSATLAITPCVTQCSFVQLSASSSLTVQAPPPASLTSPTSGTTLAGPKVTFSWTAVTGAVSYSFRLGTSVGANNVYASGATTATSVTAANLPINGETLYARLYTNFGSSQSHTDYVFTAASAAALTSPAANTTLAGPKVTFAWSTPAGAVNYSFRLGTSLGANDLYASGLTTKTSATVSNLPINGETIYGRLYTNFGSSQLYADYVFTAATAATLSSPAPSSVLTAAKVTFTWSAGSGASYSFRLGTSAGANDLYASGATTNTSVTVANLPINGETIYARLYTTFASGQAYIDYVVTAATAAILSSPLGGSTLTGSQEAFTWSAVTGATSYSFRLGTTPGANDVYASGPTTATSVTPANLPTNGETLYGRLYTNFGSNQVYTDYVFTAATQ